MQDELIELQENSKRTIVFISHDLDEAIRIGDRIAIMQDGVISQIGTPEEIISNPANEYVRSFFQGVDVTSILSASHIVKKSLPTLIKKDGFGVKSAFKYLDDFDSDYGLYLTKNRKYLGIVTMDSLKASSTIEEAIVETKSIIDTTPISELIGTVAINDFQTIVINEEGQYQGSISKTKLLKTLDEGVDHG
jgi:glycine betaine/proline transport system ATP-binding protein